MVASGLGGDEMVLVLQQTHPLASTEVFYNGLRQEGEGWGACLDSWRHRLSSRSPRGLAWSRKPSFKSFFFFFPEEGAFS